ncbi:MAG: acyl-ACP--UDP-N-acetylglucosamine O-acyltransferase [Sedimentisphaerales bacterium]|nr:acyl-ACP--UDP-N-acetylglucosamine O-acyltransferase [Sedimentisphaerales bacterium]
MAKIHPSAVIHKSANLDDRVTVGPNCVIQSGVSIGSGTILDANVVIAKDVRIGRGNHFFANSVIGARPQVLSLKSEAEIGGLVFGDDNIIREQVTIHPSINQDEQTKIGSGNFLMIGAHIGHDCIIEDKTIISNYVQISGHCRIETGVWLSGMVAIHQFVTVGKWCYAAGLTGINRDIPPFLIVSGHYPPKVRGVNKRGMKRAGLTELQQQRVMEAYKKLYRRSEQPLLDRARDLAGQEGLDDNVHTMVEAIIRSSQHRFGRYLEQFRD